MRPDEDRLLRLWTPRILRGILGASAALLAAGLVVIGITAPASYVTRYHAVWSGRPPAHPVSVPEVVTDLVHGRWYALLGAGLLLITLVPIGRVAFTVVVVVRERDWLFVSLTVLVLRAARPRCPPGAYRVLAALDRSPRTQVVFDAAAEIARRFTAALWPLSVVWVPPEFPAAAAGR
jgi:uncharacterized membrane protein